MESHKFFVAAISVLVFLIFALPAYAEVRTFSGDVIAVNNPVGNNFSIEKTLS
jgi:hypothetical protein